MAGIERDRRTNEIVGNHLDKIFNTSTSELVTGMGTIRRDSASPFAVREGVLPANSEDSKTNIRETPDIQSDGGTIGSSGTEGISDFAARALSDDLLPAEIAWLHRRRLGQTTRQYAKHLGISLKRLCEVEHGAGRIDDLMRIVDAAAPNVTLADRLRVARRRNGVPLRDIARLAGISHVTYLRLESIGDDALADFWQRRGMNV